CPTNAAPSANGRPRGRHRAEPGDFPVKPRAWRCLMTREPNAAGSFQESRRAPAGAGEASATSSVPGDLDALRAVVEGTAGGTGQEFSRSLVRHLAEAIDVHYAAVCEFLVPPRGRALAVWERDHVVENLDFDFATSPAAEVLTSGLAHF